MSNREQEQIDIVYMPLDELIRAPRNPKDHDLGTINDSISRFGYINPMLINERTGKLVAGHGRLDTLQRMKALGKKAPEHIVEKDGRWFVPVIRGVSFDTDADAEAYLIADNRLVELGGWDEEEMKRVMSDLAAQGEAMLVGTGFDMDDVDEMLKRGQIGDENEDEYDDSQIEEEELPEAERLQEKWGVVDGDVWQIGRNFVICGDSTKIKTWERLADASGYGGIDGVFTSPPYADQRSKKNVPNYSGIPMDEYVSWWESIQENAAYYLDAEGCFFLNIKPNVVNGARVMYVNDLVRAMVSDWDWQLIEEFCWERIGNPGSWPNRFKNGFEPIYQFAKQTDIVFNPRAVLNDSEGKRKMGRNKSTGNYYNVDSKELEWEGALPSNRVESFGNAMGFGHPAAFPVQLPAFFMKAFSNRNSVWIDPFAGSGTVGIAALNLERMALMIEMEPKYVSTILERHLNAIGEDPRKVG